MRCEECGKEFSFIKNNTLCAACLLKEPADKKVKSTDNKDNVKSTKKNKTKDQGDTSPR